MKDNPREYESLAPEQRTVLQRWIAASFRTARTKSAVSSYTMKHWFEDAEEGFYITNGQFKGAMLAAGHTPTKQTMRERNWCFRVRLRASAKVS